MTLYTIVLQLIIVVLLTLLNGLNMHAASKPEVLDSAASPRSLHQNVLGIIIIINHQ